MMKPYNWNGIDVQSTRYQYHYCLLMSIILKTIMISTVIWPVMLASLKLAKRSEPPYPAPPIWWSVMAVKEFIVLLSETVKDEAIETATLLLKKIEALAIPNEGSLVKKYVTVSIGVSTMLPNDHSRHEDLVKIADKALYHAKSNGRNQVAYLADAILENPL